MDAPFSKNFPFNVMLPRALARTLCLRNERSPLTTFKYGSVFFNPGMLGLETFFSPNIKFSIDNCSHGHNQNSDVKNNATNISAKTIKNNVLVDWSFDFFKFSK